MLRARALSAMFIGCVVLVVASVAFAQSPQTVAELLAKGGSRLSKDELVSLQSGAKVSGTQIDRPNTTYENVYKADGTVVGAAQTASGPVGVTGKWSVDDTGLLCQDLWNSRGFQFRECGFSFTLDGSYFEARTDNPAARLYPRSFKR